MAVAADTATGKDVAAVPYTAMFLVEVTVLAPATSEAMGDIISAMDTAAATAVVKVIMGSSRINSSSHRKTSQLE
jgi:hypothetical protein